MKTVRNSVNLTSPFFGLTFGFVSFFVGSRLRTLHILSWFCFDPNLQLCFCIFDIDLISVNFEVTWFNFDLYLNSPLEQSNCIVSGFTIRKYCCKTHILNIILISFGKVNAGDCFIGFGKLSFIHLSMTHFDLNKSREIQFSAAKRNI